MTLTFIGAPQKSWAILPQAFTSSECQNIINMAATGMQKNGSLVGGDQHHNIRRCNVSWIGDWPEAGFLHERITHLVAEANRAHFNFDLSEMAEEVQIAHYEGGDHGFYDWHVDRGGKSLASFRKLTLVGLLSPTADFSGGQLQLNANGHVETMALEQGDVVAFPSYILHNVSPVLEGERYSLTQWVHGPHFR